MFKIFCLCLKQTKAWFKEHSWVYRTPWTWLVFFWLQHLFSCIVELSNLSTLLLTYKGELHKMLKESSLYVFIVFFPLIFGFWESKGTGPYAGMYKVPNRMEGIPKLLCPARWPTHQARLSEHNGAQHPSYIIKNRRLARYACFFLRGLKMWRTDKQTNTHRQVGRKRDEWTNGRTHKE